MRNMLKEILVNRYIQLGLVAVAALFMGWVFFHSSSKSAKQNEEVEQNGQRGQKIIWTCAMHPQIRMTEPGKCPICGMDLIPLNKNEVTTEPGAIRLTPEAVQMANVLTSLVTRQKAVKEVRLYGKVQADERLLQSQVAHISGRIDKLMVNFTGETITKGQILALVYSPQLVTAQQELLEAAKTKDTQPGIYEAAREKLSLWKLTDSQISDIEKSERVKTEFEVVSNTSGIVTARRVNTGDHVEEGTVLYDIADLSDVWVMFDAYESDLPFIESGDRLDFTLQALPGETFHGSIMFIDPVVDPVTRVTKVRVEISNHAGKIKPEMFATGIVQANLNNYRDKLIIPRSALLWTGDRSIVYVKQQGTNEPIFKLREIELGPVLGNSYIVESGLEEGEEIVTQGTFSVDASAQLEGVPSMMNPTGGKVSSMPGMDMPGDTKSNSSTNDKQTGHKPTKNPEKIEVSMDFTMQLNTIFDQYIILKNAFVQSDSKKINLAAKNVQQALVKVDMKLLSGDPHMKWMAISGKLKKQIDFIALSGKIEEQRTSFSELSNQTYSAVKTFGLMGKTVYYQFCPMANNKKGAYWLSESEEIRNPYFGNKMLTCGNIVGKTNE